MNMIEKLKQVEERYNFINDRLCSPEIAADASLSTPFLKELKTLTPVVEKYREYVKNDAAVREAKEILDSTAEDKDFKELVREEYDEGREKSERLLEELKLLLLPRDENDDRNVIIEIRSSAGGEESALFAGVLFRMYSMYAQTKGWRPEILYANETTLGGYKEISFMISGEGAYSRFKFESGVHRVQRIPVTESNGKIQTSTVTVAVLPEAQEVDVEINPADLQIDTFRSSGAGGQHINKTESAIRITHIPTGIVVECQDERSQYKNKDKAMKILRSRVLELEREKHEKEIAGERRSQVGTGDRSERIRTYNFNEGRVTDHRIGKTIYTIDAFVDGDMDDIIDPLIYADQQEQLRALGQGERQRG